VSPAPDTLIQAGLGQRFTAYYLVRGHAKGDQTTRWSMARRRSMVRFR